MNLNYIHALILLGSSTLAFADIYKCHDDNGQVKYSPTPLTRLGCTKSDMPPKETKPATSTKVTKSSKGQQAEQPPASSPNAATDIVLMCEEIQERDIRLEKRLSNAALTNSPWNKSDALEYERMKKRNENIKRPYFAIKYLGGKVSFNNDGANLLIDEAPGIPNSGGLVGRILIKEGTVYFDHERITGTRTTLTIDRYTGLYKSYTFHGAELLFEADGKCKKFSEKQF